MRDSSSNPPPVAVSGDGNATATAADAAAASADCEDGDDVDGSDDTYACQHKKCQISNGMQLHALAAMPSTIPFAI
jgi:hypothetical protein